jgi:protein SCO1
MTLAGFCKFLWGMVVFATVALVAGYAANWELERRAGDSVNTAATPSEIGGAFTMTDSSGRKVTEETYAGKVWMMFMGFTNCPDICPTTLAEMSGWLQELGADEDGIRGFLVTVDPERDTPEIVGRYISSFDDRIVGLVPTEDQLESFAENYKVHYDKVQLKEGGYTMDHTAGVLLFDRSGRFIGTIDLHENRQTALAKLRNLINGEERS